MALLNSFLAGLKCPITTLLKRCLEDGIPENLQSLTHCTPTDWCLKSSSKSSELRDRGNDAYRLKNYDDALEYFSQSIAAAPTDSTALALAYGNRSTILQVQKEYELCLLDTNRALDGTIPQSSRKLLLERKAQCWEKLQEQNEVRTKLRAGLSSLRCSSQERHNLMACERKLCYISEADIDDTDLVTDRSRIDDPDFEATFENDVCGNLSPKVERRADEEWGQAFIAADDIEAGEILSADDFYALIVHEANLQEYCSYCSARCLALIPCVSCSQDMYCCVACRAKAHDTYHETECKMLPLWGSIPADEREARRLVLRIFLTGTKQGSDLTNLLNDLQVYDALNGNLDVARARFAWKDYLRILTPIRKLGSVQDAVRQWQRMKGILQIFTELRYVRYFGADVEMETRCSGNSLSGEELIAILLLVQNISIALTQGRFISANFWDSEVGKPLILRLHPIGTGVGPWHTFLNHSCNPNVTLLTSGRRLLYRSVRPIKAGEQIFQGSGQVYGFDAREERQAFFKESWGRECSCIACVKHWPVLGKLLKSRNKYRTTDRDVIKKIEKMQKWFHKKQLEDSIAEEDVKKVIEFCKIVRQHMNEPASPMILCEYFFCNALKAKGNLYFSQKYIASLYKYL